MGKAKAPTQIHRELYATLEGGRVPWLTGMVILEQKARASVALKLCIECDDPGVVYHPPGLLLQATGYWMCQECSDYWRTKD
mgnify:CR=1 FL=1